MYKPSGGESRVSVPPNARETSSLPPENSTWHREPYSRDPRTDRADRDRVGAGKRHWNGDRSSNTTSFQGVTGGASVSGNGFAPRSKPRFQGHYSGFFAESLRNGPSFSAAGSVDTGLVRRFHRSPYHSGTGPAVKSQGFGGSAGVDYRASDTEERHNRDQFASSGDEKEGRDQPLPPQAHSDTPPSLRNGERARPLGSRTNWEYSTRADRDNFTRPHGNGDSFYGRRRSTVTQFDSGKDWGADDSLRSEVVRFERYGTGSRDGSRADYEGSSKDSGFSHGWRRERSNSGGIARHSSFTAASRSLGEHGGRGSLSVGSPHDSLHATSLSSNQDADQPSPSKRPRLGWGQGLAKYEKKIGDTDDASPLAEKLDMKKEGEGEVRPTMEEVEKKGIEHEKLRPLLGEEHEYKRENGESFIDAHEKKSDLMQEHGGRVGIGQDSKSMRGEDERIHVLAQELQGLEESPASPVWIEGYEKVMREEKNEKRSAFLKGIAELEINGQNPASPILAEDSESRRREDEVTFAVLQEHESRERKDQNLASPVSVGEAEGRGGNILKDSALVNMSEEVFIWSHQNATSKNAEDDSSNFATLTKAAGTREGDICLSYTSLTELKTGGKGTENSVPTSPTPHLERIAEDNDVVSPVGASPVESSTGRAKHMSPRSHVVNDLLASPVPLLLVESIALPASSPNQISTSELSSDLQCDMTMDGKSLEGAEGPGMISLSEIELAPKGILVEAEPRLDPEASYSLVREEEANLVESEPVSAVLRTQLSIAQAAASPDPSVSQVCEKIVVTPKSETTLPESEPASEGSLVTEVSTVHTCLSEDLNDVDHIVPLDAASWTEKFILETVGRVESEIDLVRKEIAQIDAELGGDVGLETSDTHHARVSALDSPSKVAEDEDAPTPMEEDTTESPPSSVDTRVVCPSSSQSSPTAVSTRLNKSPICSERGIISSTPALCERIGNGGEEVLRRESSMTPMPEKVVLELMPEGVQLKSMGFDKDCDVKDSGSMSHSLGSGGSDYSENQFVNEMATGGSSLQERNQTTVGSLIMENKERARLSGVPFIHLLPQNLTGEAHQQLYHCPSEAPVWQRNVETHKNIEVSLLKKLSERHHFHKFKERVLTLRFRALKQAWKREEGVASERKSRPKAVGRWDSEGRSTHGPPSQRSSLRLRPPSLGRLDAESDAAQAMKKLMKDPQVEVLRPVLKMPAMILDEKERAVRRFVSKNALVEDPVAVEMERKTVNPWTAEERKIFAEQFAFHNKNFKEIATYLQHKTTADCIEYYYRNQKSEDFEKSQHGQLKNRFFTRTSSTFLTPTAAGIKRNHEANCARVEALNVANMNMSNSQLQVSEHAKPTASSSDPLSMPSNAEVPKFHLKDSKVLEVALPSGTMVEAATSSLISTPCSVSSTAAPSTDQFNEKGSVKERIGSGPSTTRSSHSEQHPAGLKGIRSTYLRRMSSRTAAQELDSQWTDGERELFTSAVATYGKDFRLIASHVGSKSQIQCKAFFSKTRKRLGLDELVEQFQANEAAAMLVQSFRHDADLVQEVKLISTPEMDASAGVIAHSVEELIDTATAVSTLESLKEQSKCLANDMSDLSLVADAAAVMEEEITLVKPECPTLELFSSGKPLTTSQDLAQELLKVDRLDFTVSPTVLKKEDEDDSEATKSDDSYQVGTETGSDIVVDQAAAALVGMSVLVTDKSGLKRSKSEAKADPISSPVSVFPRSQSARLPLTSSPPLHAVTEANLCITSGRNARQVKATSSCKPSTRDNRHQDMQDAHTGRRGRETTGEPKPRREPTSWTQEEKEKFAVILQEHGKNWALLHESLPSKSLTQIKTYFQNSKARSRLPASDKLLNVVRSRKRKAEEYESTKKATELALPVKQKVRGSVVPPELDNAPQKEDTLLGSTSVSGTTGVGVDILAYAARFGPYPGQPVDQDTLNVNGMQHLVRQMVTANTYAQGSTQDGHQQVFRPGVRPAVPPSPMITRPHSAGGMLPQLSGPSPPKATGPELQALSPGVVPQAGPPAAIHQVAQQVQQIFAQQQHLQQQLALLIQQQAAHPQQLLPQHQQVTQQAMQVVQPLEQKLQQVVQQLQLQHELQGRAQAQAQEGEEHSHAHFQHQQAPSQAGRGILKVKPIRGVVSKPQSDLAISPSPGVFPSQDKQLQLQDHSLSLGIGTISTVTAGSAAGLLESHAKAGELQDSDTDTDCEGMGSRLMAAEDSHQRMSVVHSTSSGQQQGAAQSTTSTLSSDSEQVKSWDVKLFGQSLLSKPPSLPSSVPRPAAAAAAGGSTQDASSPVATLGFPTGTLLKGFRSSESLPSAFGRVVGAPPVVAEGGQPTSWAGSGKLGQYGAWSTTSSRQLSGVTEPTKNLDSESVQEAVTSDHQHSDGRVLPPLQASEGDEEHRDSESGLSAGQSETPVCDAAVEESPFHGQGAGSEAEECQVALDPSQPTSHMNPLLAGQWG